MRTVAALVLVLVVGLSPLWLGSNRPLPWSANALMVGAVLILAGIGIVLNRSTHPSLKLAEIAFPLLLIGGVLGWALVQTLPIAAWAHPAWQVAATALGRDLAGTVSVNPTETWWAITRWLTAGGVLLAAFCLGRDRRLALILLRGFLVLASLAALYGLYRVAFSVDRILWFEVPLRRLLTSGFVNQNSAATYFGMAALAALALVLESVQQIIRDGEGFRDYLRSAGERLGGGLGLDLVLFFTLFVALLVTASRGGIFAALAGALLLLILYGLKGRRRRGLGGANWTLLILFGLTLLGGVFELSGMRFVDRLMQQGLEADERLDTYARSLDAIGDYLWLGSGLGTFQEVFPAYRLEIDPGRHVWDKAHNDYLELVLGLGLPAALVMLVGLMLIGLRALAGYFERRRDAQYAAAAVAVSVMAALHSAVDFSLQIQANTLGYSLILGVGLAQSFSSRR